MAQFHQGAIAMGFFFKSSGHFSSLFKKIYQQKSNINMYKKQMK